MSSPFRDELSVAYEKIARLEKEAAALRNELPFLKRQLFKRRPIGIMLVLVPIAVIATPLFLVEFPRQTLKWNHYLRDRLDHRHTPSSRK